MSGHNYCYPACRDSSFNECADCWHDGGNPALVQAEPLVPIDQRGTPPVSLPKPTVGKVRR